jgi:hypothetical protein
LLDRLRHNGMSGALRVACPSSHDTRRVRDAPHAQSAAVTRQFDAPTRSIEVGHTAFTYRAVGYEGDVPLILLNRWDAALDNFDPCTAKRLAGDHRAIEQGNRAINRSGGTAPVTTDKTAQNVIAPIRALCYRRTF